MKLEKKVEILIQSAASKKNIQNVYIFYTTPQRAPVKHHRSENTQGGKISKQKTTTKSYENLKSKFLNCTQRVKREKIEIVKNQT